LSQAQELKERTKQFAIVWSGCFGRCRRQKKQDS